MDKKRIGEELRALRIKRGLRAREAANLAGIGTTTISLVELGKVELSLPVFCALLQAYGLNVTIENYGAKLRRARRHLDMTQASLAIAAGLTEPQVSCYEREIYYPRMEKHKALCKALGENPVGFMEETWTIGS